MEKQSQIPEKTAEIEQLLNEREVHIHLHCTLAELFDIIVKDARFQPVLSRAMQTCAEREVSMHTPTSAQTPARLVGARPQTGTLPHPLDRIRCTKCGETKVARSFYRNRSNKDGLDYYCKACRKKCNKESTDARRKEQIANGEIKPRAPRKIKAHLAARSEARSNMRKSVSSNIPDVGPTPVTLLRPREPEA